MIALYDLAIGPFVEFGFMRRALVACLALSLGSGTIGVFLVLRRMSLMAEALAHAVLPGAAIGFLVGGLWLPALSIGGFLAGLAVGLLSGAMTRLTRLREDASFASAYLIALALGVLIVSTRGSSVDLMQILFGSILAVDDLSLMLVASVASVTLVVLAIVFRPLVVEFFDPGFLQSLGVGGGRFHMIFLVLAVLNLVAGFQALGTLMAVGLMVLPAAAAGFWARRLWSLAAVSAGIAFASGAIGLLVSFHADLPSGPSIVLTAGAIHVASLALGTQGSLRLRLAPPVHLRG